jgi:hypothetical protein
LKRLSDRGLCGGPPDGSDDLVAYEKLAAGMTPDWQAHDCRVTLRALKRFGMAPGDDSRTMFGTLLVHLLHRCCAFVEKAAARDRTQCGLSERVCPRTSHSGDRLRNRAG